MKTLHSRDGTRIAYDRTGEGPPLVLVGGALTDRSYAAPLAALLAPHFTVFSYDRRGRGDSTDTPPWSLEREVEDLQTVVTEAGGKAFAFGVSSGALLVTEAAGLGVELERIALYEPPFDAFGRGPRISKQLAALTAHGRRGDALELFFREAIGLPPEAIAEQRKLPFWPALEAVAPTLPYDTAIVELATVVHLARVDVPALVLAGTNSFPQLRELAEATAAALPLGTLRLLDGQSHTVVPEVVAPVLREFFLAPAQRALAASK